MGKRSALAAPARNQLGGEGVPKIVESEGRPGAIARNAVREAPESPMSADSVKRSTPRTGEKGAGEWETSAANSLVAPEGANRGRVQRQCADRTLLAGRHSQRAGHGVEILIPQPEGLASPQSGASEEADERAIDDGTQIAPPGR